MTRLLLILALGIVLLSCKEPDSRIPASAQSIYFKPDSGYIPGMVFVMFNEGTTTKQIKTLLDSLGLSLEGGPYGETLGCNVGVPVDSEFEAIKRLRMHPIVRGAGRGIMSRAQIEYR